MTKKDLSELYIEAAKNKFCDREREWPDINMFREFERQIILICIDVKWMQHINDLEILRQNISLVFHAQIVAILIPRRCAFCSAFSRMIP